MNTPGSVWVVVGDRELRRGREAGAERGKERGSGKTRQCRKMSEEDTSEEMVGG